MRTCIDLFSLHVRSVVRTLDHLQMYGTDIGIHINCTHSSFILILLKLMCTVYLYEFKHITKISSIDTTLITT